MNIHAIRGPGTILWGVGVGFAATTSVLSVTHSEIGYGVLYALIAAGLAVLAIATYRGNRPAQMLTFVLLGGQCIGAVGAAWELRYGRDDTAKARHLHDLGINYRFALAVNLVFSTAAALVFLWAILGQLASIRSLRGLNRRSALGERRHGQRGGRGVTRYVEAVLLALLAEDPAHGYDLNERLGGVFPLPDSLPDVSTVYRALGDLEAQGAIRATWADGDGGGRKVYELTEAGDDLLEFWVERFEEEQTGVARFLDMTRKTIRSRARRGKSS